VATEDKKILYEQIAELVNDIFIENGMKKTNYYVSHILDGLPLTPTKNIFPKYWNYISEKYHEINGHRLNLDKVLSDKKSELVEGYQEADIFFYSPFKMIVEYDEKQHFNQFRKSTLDSNVYTLYNGFEIDLYKKLNQRVIKPGKKSSGFRFLKHADPLFPPNEDEKNQDNRDRQRAFRDFLKDIVCLEWDIKPTIRIPAFIVKWKRKNLNRDDLKIIKTYLQSILTNN
jgi:hypothetical protein